MALFFFNVRSGHASVCNDGAEFPSCDAAWKEMTRVCSEIVGGVSGQLGENADWQMELLDESLQPVLRIRLVAETLD